MYMLYSIVQLFAFLLGMKRLLFVWLCLTAVVHCQEVGSSLDDLIGSLFNPNAGTINVSPPTLPGGKPGGQGTLPPPPPPPVQPIPTLPQPIPTPVLRPLPGFNVILNLII